MRFPTMLVLACLLVLPPAQGVHMEHEDPEVTYGTACTPPEPDHEWVIVGAVVCMDRTITVRNLVVYNGASLILDNVELVINAEYDAAPVHGGRLLYVFSHANLDMRDSLMRPLDERYRPMMASSTGATTHIQNTTFLNVWGIQSAEPASFVMRDSRFVAQGRQAMGIGTFDTPNHFFLNNFITNAQVGIYAGPGQVIENNTITDCWVGISVSRVPRGPDSIQDNTITDCGVGIVGASVDENFSAHRNDIYNMHPVVQGGDSGGASFYGDARWNWWGQSGPPADRHEQWGRVPATDPWSRQPNHPERMPRIHVDALPQTVHRGEWVSFNASASQPSQAFGFPLTLYQWSLGDGRMSREPIVRHAYDAPGTYEVSLRVFDEHRISQVWTDAIRVVNRAPGLEARLVPDRPVPDQVLRVEVDAVDADGDALATSMRWSRNGSLVPELENASAVPASMVRGGDSWTVEVHVVDSYGAAASRSLGATVETPLPRIHALEAGPGSPLPGQALWANASAKSPDGGASVAYRWYHDGVAVVRGMHVPGEMVVPGSWRVEATPRNAYGAGPPSSATLTVPAPPTEPTESLDSEAAPEPSVDEVEPEGTSGVHGVERRDHGAGSEQPRIDDRTTPAPALALLVAGAVAVLRRRA